MVKVGQVVMKISGRDAGQLGVVIDTIDNNYALVDGLVRRRKCNIKHLEFLDLEVKVKKNATHEEITKTLIDLGFKIKEVKKGKKKEAKEKPKKLRKDDRKKIEVIEGKNEGKK